MHATLSHYRVLEQIGEGGMGVVYRAHDQHLDCDVALKVLPAGELAADDTARKRFRKEALALSKLNHPNIAVIHDFDTQDGTDFLVEELIPGLSLNEMLASGALPEHDILHLGVQICEGLATAHEQGIIHRDLKPANIRVMPTPDRRVKILDFGLAKLLPRMPVGSEDVTISETQSVSGTLPYMAPEQVMNQRQDACTDIWALGCVLYEMATGRRPFSGSGITLADQIRRQQPTPPAKVNHKISPGLEAIILKCLEKDPGHRYASARDVAVGLRQLETGVVPRAQRERQHRIAWKITAAACALIVLLAAGYAARRWLWPQDRPIHSIAVLPFTNLSGDPQQDYLAEGMTDALIMELSKISSLKVTSRTSTMQYKNAKKAVRQIAKELGVQAVIEGAVVRENQRVRVTVRFLEAATDRNIWADRYDREMSSIIALQSEVAHDIAVRTRTEITAQEKVELARARTVTPEAYEAYLRGRYVTLDSWDPEKMTKAEEYYKTAIALDPRFALAYARLSMLYFEQFEYGHAAEGKAAAAKALELDESLAEAHIAVAEYTDLPDWATKEREYKRALELRPGDAVVLDRYASYYLSLVGRHDEAIALLKRVVELDPISGMTKVRLGRRLFYARRYDEAIDQFKLVLEVTPDEKMTRANLGRAYLFKGMIEPGLAELQAAGEPDELAYGYCMVGRKRQGLSILDQHREEWARVRPMMLATIYGACGEKDKAFQWLEHTYTINGPGLQVLKVSPALDPLRSDPRFGDLLHRMNFPT